MYDVKFVASGENLLSIVDCLGMAIGLFGSAAHGSAQKKSKPIQLEALAWIVLARQLRLMGLKK